MAARKKIPAPENVVAEVVDSDESWQASEAVLDLEPIKPQRPADDSLFPAWVRADMVYKHKLQAWRERQRGRR